MWSEGVTRRALLFKKCGALWSRSILDAHGVGESKADYSTKGDGNVQ